MNIEAKYTKRRRIFSAVLLLIIIGLVVGLAYNARNLKLPERNVATHQPGLYEVVAFSDGDTIKVDMNGTKETIRMIGVDTPETKDPRKPVQCFGKAASAFTKQLIGTKRVRLETDSQSTNRDRYDRLLRYVYLPDGRLVAAEIIKEGYGFAYLGFPFDKSDDFKRFEDVAKQAGKGLWSTCEQYVDSKGSVHTNSE